MNFFEFCVLVFAKSNNVNFIVCLDANVYMHT